MRQRGFFLVLGVVGPLFMSFVPGTVARAQSNGVVDHLSLPGPIAFDGESYQLSWSSHPTPDYYTQEYLTPGQPSERFERMVLVNAVVGKGTVKDVSAAKVDELNKRKATDSLVNFAVAQYPETGEIILDFILSAKDAQGAVIVEWNAYRYASLRGAKAGVLLFGISRRGYGDGAKDFLRGLKAIRPVEINALAKLPLPVARLLD